MPSVQLRPSAVTYQSPGIGLADAISAAPSEIGTNARKKR